MKSKVITKLVREIYTLRTVSIMLPLLGYQTNCYFRNNSITHGLHTYWKDSGQDNSWVMCITLHITFDSFHQAVYQTKQNLNHMLSHVDWCATSELGIFLWGSPCKHTVTPQSHCTHWLWPSLGPSGCLAFSDTAFPPFWLRLLHLSQTGSPVGRKGEEK